MSRKTFKRITAVGLALLAAAQLSGCGGGDGGEGAPTTPPPSGNNPNPPPPPPPAPPVGSALGVFLDSPVQGLRYTTSPSNVTGVTNANGEFTYNPGDTVTFALGDLVLGSVPAQAEVTPLAVAQALVAATPGGDVETITVNLLAFLQSLDADGNPDNGITLNTAVAEEMASNAIDFTADATAFTTSLTGLVANVAANTGADLTVVSREDATEHFVGQIPALVAGTYVFASAEGVAVTQNTRTLTLFENGTYVYGGHDDDPNCNGDGGDEDADGNGVEMGAYAFNPLTHELTFEAAFETNGSCGPGGTVGAEAAPLTLEIEGEVLHIQAEDGATDLVAVQSVANGLGGSWAIPAGLLNNRPFVISFFPSAADASVGRYFVADASLAAPKLDTDESSGIEAGCYALGENGALSIDLNAGTCPGAIDTNDTAGLSHGQGALVAEVDAHGRLRINEGAIGDDGTTDFVRLPLQPSVIGDRVGTWYVENPGVEPQDDPNILVASFFANGRYLLGGVHDDESCDDSSNPYQDDLGNGAEFGTLESPQNALHGVVIAAATTDTNGSCGLTDENHPAQRFMFVRSPVEDTLLLFAYDDGMGAVLKRVPSVEGEITGAWLLDGTAEDHPHLGIFLPGGTLFEVSTAAEDEAGLWRSRFEVNVAGTELTLFGGGQDCFDSMGFPSCELTEAEGEEVLDLTLTDATLELVDVEQEVYSYTKITP
jgi:hypothetical protein